MIKKRSLEILADESQEKGKGKIVKKILKVRKFF